jgi:hypothetical protein
MYIAILIRLPFLLCFNFHAKCLLRPFKQLLPYHTNLVCRKNGQMKKIVLHIEWPYETKTKRI